MKRNKVSETVAEGGEGTSKISVYLPRDEQRRFASLLSAKGRKQAPVIADWIRQYIAGDRDLPPEPPPAISGNPSAAELNFLSEVLDLIRSDRVAHSGIEAMVKSRKKKHK